MARFLSIRDPIHGFVELLDDECDVIDLPVFQRLRRVHQLALAHLIYPGAVHKRFEHTLGVTHVAGRLCGALGIDESHRRLVRLAALLHDVGHGPFSHVSEDVLEKVNPSLSKDAGAQDKIHEVITRRIILRNTGLASVISDRRRQDVVTLLDEGIDDPIYKDLVSGPIDADKQDYLLRDSYFCGVRYGLFDLAQLHNVLVGLPTSEGAVLAVRQEGLHTFEQFVLARYFLTTQVIRHKGRTITDQMLTRALELGVQDDRIGFLQKLYTYEDTDDFANNYLTWTDDRLISRLLEPEHEQSKSGGMVRRLVDRRLFKRLVIISLKDLPPELSITGKVPAADRRRLEAQVAEFISEKANTTIEPFEVIIHKTRPPATRKSEGPVLIARPGGLPPATFETESRIFGSVTETLDDEVIECYAPLQVRNDQIRRVIEQETRNFIVEQMKLWSSSQQSNQGN